ncbi:MucBP domain-containing protein [Limosilactobacillus sp. BG-AF3-A]|nr:MucBP domain-containing protein [Limosilactobacillus balticus]
MFDTEITLQPSEITGYLTPVLQTVRVTGATTIKFVYSRQELPIQIEFVDQDGRALQSPETITARYGEKLSLEPVVIDGYTAPGGQELTVEKADKVTFVYHRINRPANATFNPQPPSRRSPVPVRVVRQATTRRSAPVVMRSQPTIVRNVVRPQAITRPVYRSTVQVQGRPITARPVPKLPTVNTRIYNPTKRVNKQVQKKKQTDWFEKNTGMDKQDQKVFFDVLKAIDKDGKKRGLSQQQRNQEMAYYIAGVSYAGNDFAGLLQRSTSRISKYNYNNLKKIVGNSKASYFLNVVVKGRNQHKVDFPHLMVALAGAKEQHLIPKTIQTITTFPDQIRSLIYFALYRKNLTNTHGLPTNIEQWLFANGFYGDKIADHNISKEDLHADLDSYFLVNAKGSMVHALWQLYNSDPQALARKRQLQEKGMAERTQQTRTAKVGTIIVGALSLSTLGLGIVDYMKNRRKAKESAKKQVQNVVNGLKKDGKVIANDIKVVYQNQRRTINNTIRTLPQRMTQAARRQVQTVQRAATKAINNVKRVVRPIVKPVQRFVQRITRPVIQRVNRTVTTIRQMPQRITRSVRRVTRAVQRTYRKVTRSVSRTVKRTVSRVKRFFRRRR